MTVRRPSFLIALVALALAWSSAPDAALQPPPATGIVNLGDLSGWKAEPASDWQLVDGVIVHARKPGGGLTTAQSFGDFELQAEYQAGPSAQASILLRDAVVFTLGGLPGPGWTPLSITLVGERVTLTSKGFTTLRHQRAPNARDAGQPAPLRGPVMFRAGGPIKLRNITIREIGAAEANAILAKHDGAGFEPVFDGKTFDGWAGPLENYQIVDGAILCKPEKGGTIYTKNEYRDFMVRLEFKLPPGGNNGLAIRYPGEGDAAYGGMTELQVLDNTAGKYATLDPRQFHGSAYGMVPAVKGYQRPVGEWNFQEVTVRGSKIVVELNGTRILDADLSKVKDFMANSPHPGKGRTSGHFGFAGHGDPVQFRNVQIKPL
jgi:Domain of Unknown Function (DUF1080)